MQIVLSDYVQIVLLGNIGSLSSENTQVTSFFFIVSHCSHFERWQEVETVSMSEDQELSYEPELFFRKILRLVELYHLLDKTGLESHWGRIQCHWGISPCLIS